jgi:hypothetical protein
MLEVGSWKMEIYYFSKYVIEVNKPDGRNSQVSTQFLSAKSSCFTGTGISGIQNYLPFYETQAYLIEL